MKKLLTLFLLVFVFTLCAAAADTVYLDGTGATADAYTDFATAFAALENGGTLVVCGDTTFGTNDKGVTLSKVNGKVTITSQNGATLSMARSLTLNSEIEFNNIKFASVNSSNRNIIANGNPITFGENVTVTSSSYPIIIGGASGGTLNSDSHITVKSGTFVALYGGNYAGTFNGNSTVDVLGGTITSAISGGNYNGNFKGNATVNVGGDAVVEYSSSANVGIVGGTIGSSSATATSYTFEGDIAVNFFGNAEILANSYTASRYKNITTTGNITFTAYENAYIKRQTYVGGYYGNVNGDITLVLKDNVKAGLSSANKFVCAGAYEGDVNGNCSLEISDNVRIYGAAFAGCYNGDVSGNTSIVMDGGNVTSTFSPTSRTGSTGGTVTAIIKDGTVGGDIKGNVTIALDADSTVTIKTVTGEITATAPEGYEVAVDGTTYTAVKIASPEPEPEPEEPEVIPTEVYANGTGEGGAYTTLADAAAALKNGGDIILTGDVSITSATVLPEGVALNISAENGAVLHLGARLTLGGETVFDNITINNSPTSYQLIVANGNPITIGEGVVCTTNGTELVYPTIIGGKYDTACESGSHITIKGGTWRNVYGANYNGSFTGNSTVDFTGGTVLVTLSGGSYSGDYTGTATLNIGGNAVVEYNTIGGAALGVVGGNVGVDNGNARTFSGTININIGGNATVNPNINGTSRMNNITTVADVNIDIFGNADINRNVYAAGWLGNTTSENGINLTVRENASISHPTASAYVCAGAQSGTVTGDVKVVVKDNAIIVGNVYGAGYSGSVVGNSIAEIYGGTVSVNFTAGSRSGNVSGDATANVYGGTIGFDASGNYGVRANGGTAGGTVSGTASVVIDGATIAGNVIAGCDNYDITLRGGDIGGTATDKVKIDLSTSKSLKINGSVVASDFIGGGTITLASDGSIVTDKMSGEATLVIDGTPTHNHAYITVNDATSEATVAYTSVAETDVLNKVVGDTIAFTLRYTDRYDTTHVKVYYYNPLENAEKQPSIVMVKGLSSEDDRVSITLTSTTEDGKGVAEADLTPGLYYYKVYYNGASDYAIKYFYVSGRAESLTFDAPLEPLVENSYMENCTSITTDEVLAHLSTDNLVGYTAAETLAIHMDRRAFLTNAEICEYVATLDQRSEYLHVFYPFEESEMGNEWPVMVFTKDTVAEGASFEDVAAAIRAEGEREILMITAGVHGNEPAGPEGALFFASELCTEYGEEVLDHFGAIVMMPVVSVDNNQRFKRTTVDGINPNRDLVALKLPSTQHQVYLYKNFMPTITIDCHEDTGSLTADESDYSIENMDDVCIRYSGVQNSPLYDVNAFANGTDCLLNQRGIGIMLDAIEATRAYGLRSSIYYSEQPAPVSSTAYPSTRGSYGFIIETMRLWSGKGRHERAVFAMKTALKSLVAEFIEADGAIAADVYAARAKLENNTKFDDSFAFATKTSKSGNALLTMPRPTVYVDGTFKDENNTKSYKFYDTVSGLRTLPTAYVIDADAENIDEILSLLDLQGISYTRIAKNATLELCKYEGISSAATSSVAVTIADAAEVTFENGAYVVTTNNANAYLIAYLFEPDSCTFSSVSETSVSLAHIGYLSDNDSLYRAELDDMADVIADMLYVEGDINGDGKVDISDVMLALRKCLNESGSLLDVIRILKIAVG